MRNRTARTAAPGTTTCGRPGHRDLRGCTWPSRPHVTWHSRARSGEPLAGHGQVRAGRRPSRRAAAATAAATAGRDPRVERARDDPVRDSSSATTAASASAAASFIPSVIEVARTASAPRKMPGNASTLLIWLG